MAKQTVGFIVGPTASGKTALSVALAKRMQAEIVSADSMQIYRGMDIGSAKPTLAERAGIAHHMLDILPATEAGFSVALYQKMAREAIAAIAARGKFPLVVGGTGLYCNALTYPLDFAQASSDPALRDALNAREQANPGCLYAELCERDAQTAARLHPNDVKRIVRALEVQALTGRSMAAAGGDFSNTAGREIPYTPHIVGLTMPRERLYARIDERVEQMMADGLLKEVRACLAAGCTAETPAMQGLGYKQLIAFLQGECSLAESVERIKRETRRFAKRQMTWFRRDARIRWLDVSTLTESALLDAAQAHLAGTEEEL